MDFTFFNDLIINKLQKHAFGLFINGYLDSFIDNIDVKYRRVIIDNEITIRSGDEFDANVITIKPSNKWSNTEKDIDYNVTIVDFRQYLNLEVIKIMSTLIKNDALKWKLNLIGAGNKEVIKKEYDNFILQLLIYETEFKNAEHLKPYFSVLADLIKDLRKDISTLTLLFKGNDVIEIPSNNESVFYDLENKFNKVPLIDVKNHFIQLTVKTSKKNGKPHLTKEQLTQFIEIAFLDRRNADENKKKIRMNFDRGELHTIRKVFYDFYKTYRSEYESSQSVKEKYVKLLTDNFEGFDYTKIANNFDK